MKKTALILILIIFLFSTCALEIANVIGPGGGYVFFDKGNYAGGWRYIECSPYDFGEIKEVTNSTVINAMKTCIDHSAEWYLKNWELPQEADLKKMLECFSYGLTRFKDSYYYLAVNKNDNYDPDHKRDECAEEECTQCGEKPWEAVVLHKSFEVKANGEVARAEIETVNKDSDIIVRIRPIRRF